MKVLFQGVAYAALILLIGWLYRGSEGQLVKEAVVKMTSIKR